MHNLIVLSLAVFTHAGSASSYLRCSEQLFCHSRAGALAASEFTGPLASPTLLLTLNLHSQASPVQHIERGRIAQ